MTDEPGSMALTFRSALLAARVDRPTVMPVARRLRRTAPALVCGSLAVLLAVGVAGRWWPPSGLGAWLYGLHDNVYLPLKGNLWTRFLPVSAVMATALAFVILMLSLRRWVFGPLHRRCLGALIDRPSAHWALAAWAGRTAGTRLAPLLLCETVERERTRSIDAAITALRIGRAPDEPAERLIQLTKLALRTCCVCMPIEKRAEAAAALVIEALVWRLWAPPTFGHPAEDPRAFAGLETWATLAGLSSLDLGLVTETETDETPFDARGVDTLLADTTGLIEAAIASPAAFQVAFPVAPAVDRALARVDALERWADAAGAAAAGRSARFRGGAERLAFLFAAGMALYADVPWLAVAHADARRAARFAADWGDAGRSEDTAASAADLDDAWLVSALTARMSRSSVFGTGQTGAEPLFGAGDLADLRALGRLRAAAAAIDSDDNDLLRSGERP